jgi:hypothetical protein
MAGRCVWPCNSVVVPAPRNAVATLSVLTSAMAYSKAEVCAWLPTRAAPASARRESTIGFPHRAAQPLIGAVIGTERIAVHHQHRFPIQSHDQGIGNQLRAAHAAELR